MFFVTGRLHDADIDDEISNLFKTELQELREIVKLEEGEHALSIRGLPALGISYATSGSWGECRGTVRTWRFILAIVASGVVYNLRTTPDVDYLMDMMGLSSAVSMSCSRVSQSSVWLLKKNCARNPPGC